MASKNARQRKRKSLMDVRAMEICRQSFDILEFSAIILLMEFLIFFPQQSVLCNRDS